MATPLRDDKSTNAVSVLHGLIENSQRDRQRLSAMIVGLREAFVAERSRADIATQENESLKDQVVGMTDRAKADAATIARLEREVGMMAAAIQLAQEEISTSDMALLDAVESVEGEVSVAPWAAPARDDVPAEQRAGGPLDPDLADIADLERMLMHTPGLEKMLEAA